MANHTSPPDVTVRRVYQVYLYAVCFVSVLVVLFAAAEAIYSVVRIVAPETTAGVAGAFSPFPGSSGGPADFERDQGTAELIQNLILGGLAFGIFVFHWKRAAEVRGELERITAAAPAPAPATEAPAPEAPAPPPRPARRAPRRRRPRPPAG